MTSKQQAILAIGGVGAFLILHKKKGTLAAATKTPAKGTPIAGGTGGTGSVSKPNTTNLATRNGTALTPQAPSTVSRIISGLGMGIKDLSHIFNRTGQPTNARPPDKGNPGGTSPKASGGGGGGGGGSNGASSSRSGGNVAGIPADGTPEYDTYGNLIGYDDGKTGEFVDLRTPAYDNAGNEIGYYDADGNFSGESVLFDPTTPGTTDLPSMGAAGAADPDQPILGMNADGTASNDGPALETINDDPSQSWFAPPMSDDSNVVVDSPADSAVVDPGTSYDAGTPDYPSDASTYPEPMYNPMDDANGDGLNTDDDYDA